MEIDKEKIESHCSEIERALRSVCDLPPKSRYVVAESVDRKLHVGLVHSPAIPIGRQRSVRTDLGVPDHVYGLPTPDSDEPRFWIGLQELWDFPTKRKLAFVTCGLRVYAGRIDQNPEQVFRLEWTSRDKSGIYQGGGAAHPHWHVDRAALVRGVTQQRALQALENIPIAALEDRLLEDFVPVEHAPTVDAESPDYSWLTRVHLPAHASWMHAEWDGEHSPGPHQCEPETLAQLNRWWAGALRYVRSELRRHAI